MSETHELGTIELPARFVGAWERVELRIDGNVLTAGHAVWIEGGAGFVDIRGSGDPAQGSCFAGTTAWCEPYLTWAHEVGGAPSLGGDTTDIGRITMVDDDVLEEGVFPGEPSVRYAVRWRRLAKGDEPAVVAASEHGLAVRVGDHAATVVDARAAGGPIAARYDRWNGRVWCTELAFGEPRASDALPPPLDPAWPTPAGWWWR